MPSYLSKEISECGKFYIYKYPMKYFHKKSGTYKECIRTMRQKIRTLRRGRKRLPENQIKDKLNDLTDEQKLLVLQFINNFEDNNIVNEN